jgi:hypothetical protein
MEKYTELGEKKISVQFGMLLDAEHCDLYISSNFVIG